MFVLSLKCFEIRFCDWKQLQKYSKEPLYENQKQVYFIPSETTTILINILIKRLKFYRKNLMILIGTY